MGTQIELTASDGATISAYRADPAGKPRGGLIVCQEIFGVNVHVRGVCDRYAQEGYLAIAPAFFDRVQPGVELGYEPDDIAKGRELMQKISIDNALKDVAAALAVASEAGKVGIVGYCWGGTVAWMACRPPFPTMAAASPAWPTRSPASRPWRISARRTTPFR